MTNKIRDLSEQEILKKSGLRLVDICNKLPDLDTHLKENWSALQKLFFQDLKLSKRVFKDRPGSLDKNKERDLKYYGFAPIEHCERRHTPSNIALCWSLVAENISFLIQKEFFGVVLITWLFSFLWGQRSKLYTEILRKYIATGLASRGRLAPNLIPSQFRFYKGNDFINSVRGTEEVLFQLLHDNLVWSDKSPLSLLFNNYFKDNMQNICPEVGETNRKKFAEYFKDNHLYKKTIFLNLKRCEFSNQQNSFSAQFVSKSEGFGPLTAPKGYLHELFVAEEIAKVTMTTSEYLEQIAIPRGVVPARSSQGLYLLICLPLFINYRKKSGMYKNFKDWMRHLKVESSDISLEVAAPVLISDFYQRSPRLKPQINLSEISSIANDYWKGRLKNPEDLGNNILYVSFEALKSEREWLRTASYNIKPREPGKKRRGPVLKITNLESPKISFMGDKPLKFKMIRLRGKVYFSSPWVIKDGDRFRYNKSQAKFFSRPFPGVKFIKQEDEFFYTFDFFKNILKLEILKDESSDFYRWFKSYRTVSSNQFRDLRKMEKRRYVDVPARMERLKNDLSIRSNFTKEEDEAIVKFFRPGIAPQTRRELEFICYGRTWRAISCRAQFLCESMLQEGVYDLEQLPHSRYSAVLGKKAEKVRKAVEAFVQSKETPLKIEETSEETSEEILEEELD
jgi:hypothetical protein